MRNYNILSIISGVRQINQDGLRQLGSKNQTHYANINSP